MFRFKIRDVLFLAVLVVVACADLRADEPRPTLKELLRQEPDESRNSAPAAVRDHLLKHAKPQWGATRHLLVISWFLGTGRTALQYTVAEDGTSDNVREVYNWASQDWHQKLLAADDLNRLAKLLPKLPESTAEPPVERTVHVSFQSGEKWRTVTYDAAALPNEFEKVILIIGERFETADRHKKK